MYFCKKKQTMSSMRQKAYIEALGRTPLQVDFPRKLSEVFAENVFHQEVMREYLPEDAFKSMTECVQNGQRLDRNIADQIASAMKDWAITKGATHYTHWFQPLSGTTAEKHDAFFKPVGPGRAIERFSGDLLVQQESDASSFPNGGIRNTFEARGYTAWDPSSPTFVIGKTLCIPTIFVSYTGESLDFKLPLLKALGAIDQAAVAVCQYFDKNITKVIATLGWEQEYFLIDEALYTARPDIMMTGRALVGSAPAKGQQLEDHYFGSIPRRVTAFMREFEYEAIRLGIPVTTRHNEVAPNQFECAPIFEECNLANDHNLLLMDLMEKIAIKHHFRVLLHEKPFSGVNGSGKHNNWSLSTNTGVNLLAPGKNPKSNLQFLTFFVNTIKAIHDNADLLRASIASASNDYRLGANEAPPAIISMFLGSYLSSVLDSLEESIKKGKMTPEDKTALKLDIGKIPEIIFDNTDRNRTSPFAFTGNKFEYRAVGSTANCGKPMTMLNTIVAHQLKKFKVNVDDRIEKGDSKDEAIFKEIKQMIKDSKKIRFEGNGYGDEWVKEAEKRGLSNLKDSPSALSVWNRKEVIELFEDMKVLTAREIEARQEVEYENYVYCVQIEARVLEDLVNNKIIPSVIDYQNKLIENVRGMKEVFPDNFEKVADTQLKLLQKISIHLNKMKGYSDEMLVQRKAANKIEQMDKRAQVYCDNVKAYFSDIRYHADKLELLVSDDLWPLPKFREILFTK